MENAKEVTTEEITTIKEKLRAEPIDIKKYLNTRYDSSIPPSLLHRISVAPMLDITNVHFRFFMRLLTRQATLWTEMIHENAILNNKFGNEEFLRYHPIEHPIVLQIGGNTPESLAKCALIAQEMGYDEINLNVGCPSSRVQEGAFGACLMKEPKLVSECCLEMRKAVKIPVTIKTRLGVDDFDSYEFARDFIASTAKNADLSHFIMHARKAFLKGLNPKENRSIPPLHYDRVLKLKQDLPELEFTINGGFKDFKSVQEILSEENKLKGCMIGRAAHETPWLFCDVDRLFYGKKNPGYSRREILEIYAEYGAYEIERKPDLALPNLTKPIINLFANERNNAKYRQFLSDPENWKAFNKDFREFMHGCIDHMALHNIEVLDEKPPQDEPKILV